MLMGRPPQSTVLWIVHPQYPESILHTQVALYHPESSTSWHSSVGHSAAVQPMVSLGSTTHKEQSISTVASCSSLGSPTHEDMAIIFTVNSQGSTIPGTFSEQSATLELKSLVSCIHEVPAVTPLNCQGSSLPQSQRFHHPPNSSWSITSSPSRVVLIQWGRCLPAHGSHDLWLSRTPCLISSFFMSSIVQETCRSLEPIREPPAPYENSIISSSQQRGGIISYINLASSHPDTTNSQEYSLKLQDICPSAFQHSRISEPVSDCYSIVLWEDNQVWGFSQWSSKSHQVGRYVQSLSFYHHPKFQQEGMSRAPLHQVHSDTLASYSWTFSSIECPREGQGHTTRPNRLSSEKHRLVKIQSAKTLWWPTVHETVGQVQPKQLYTQPHSFIISQQVFNQPSVNVLPSFSLSLAAIRGHLSPTDNQNHSLGSFSLSCCPAPGGVPKEVRFSSALRYSSSGHAYSRSNIAYVQQTSREVFQPSSHIFWAYSPHSQVIYADSSSRQHSDQFQPWDPGIIYLSILYSVIGSFARRTGLLALMQ